MVRFILGLLFALFCVTGNAEVKRDGNTFKVEASVKSQDTQTKYTWEDKEGKKYPIFITKNGACYINKVSKKSGKEYKYYLPKDAQSVIKKELGK